MKKRYRIYYTLLAGLLLGSCNKFLNIPTPENQLLKSNVFTDDQSATAAILGIYSSISTISSPLSATMQLVAGLASDGLAYTDSDDNYQQFQANALQTDNEINLNAWTHLYRNVYYANAAIEGLQVSVNVSDSVKARLTGEAKLVRAFCFFYLVNLWGDVPLVTGTDYQVNQLLARAPREKVYDQILTDLVEAKELLTEYYPTGERVRPNKYTAAALLARIYLYRENWSGAAEQSDAVINSGLYGLADPDLTFLKESPETIWQLMPVFPSYNTIMGQQVLPSSPTRIPRFIVTDDLVKAFEEGDQRKTAWINANMVSKEVYHYPYKYKFRSGGQLDEYFIVFRLAEQYLIRAEARARLGDIARAQEDINVIRHRAGLGNTAASKVPDLLAAIEQERRTELFTEWGDRWLYLKRSGRADKVLSHVKGANWQDTDTLWPVPFEQMQVNPQLVQNEGY